MTTTTKIRNINDSWGEPCTFDSTEEMEAAILECGPDFRLPEDGLREGRDYDEVVVGDAKDVFDLRHRGHTADGRVVVSDGACLIAPRHAAALEEEIAVLASLEGEDRAEKIADLYATWCREWDVQEVAASEVIDG